MSERLKGKIGIVTGAGTGIGRACAIALAREGAQVCCAPGLLFVGAADAFIHRVHHPVEKSCARPPLGLYSVGLLRAETEIPVKNSES